MVLENTDMKRNYHYEVIAWSNARQEAYHANCTSKAEALRIARSIRNRYGAVELNKVYTAADDDSNYLGFEAITF